jgi:hypothetical protein
MVVEFSNRLRKELIKLRNRTTSELPGRAGTSDTGNYSMDTISPMDMGLSKKISLWIFKLVRFIPSMRFEIVTFNNFFLVLDFSTYLTIFFFSH